MPMHTKESLNDSPHYESLIKEVLARSADWLNKNWGVKSVLQFLPCTWSPLLSKLPFFIDDGNSLNVCGWIVAGLIYLCALAVTLLTAFKNSRDQKRKEIFDSAFIANGAELDLRKTIAAGESTIEQHRVNRIVQQAFPRGIPVDKSVKEMIKKAFNPQDHIISILTEIVQCFATVTELPRNEIHISAAVAEDGKSNWKWLYSSNAAGSTDIRKLLSNKSALRKVIDGLPYFYCNDKTLGEAHSEYYMDGRDKVCGGVGSIICWEVMAKYDNRRCIRMIVSLSTYGQKLIEGNEPDAELQKTLYEDRIKDIILEQFKNELIEDLLLLRLIS